MSPLALAEQYMRIFFSGKNLGELTEIFAEKLRFSGPFHEFTSAADYVDSLKSDPPVDCRYKIIRAFEDRTSACLFYEFSKPGVQVPMAQLFETENGKIHRIVLLFDTGRLARPDLTK